MESRNTLIDFMDRTLRNLRKGEHLAAGDPHAFFEITQLVNSVIGMLIFPAEEALNCLPDEVLEKQVTDAQPRILHGNPDTFSRIGPALRKLRNSFAHFNIEFESYNNQIVGLYAWSFPHPNATQPDWIAYVSTEDLRSLLIQGCGAFKEYAPTEPRNRIRALEVLLNKPLRISNPGGR